MFRSTVLPLPVWNMILIVKTRGCRHQGHAVDAVPHLISTQAINGFLLRDTIATA